MKGATKKIDNKNKALEISIHAPNERSDNLYFFDTLFPVHFNPRS